MPNKIPVKKNVRKITVDGEKQIIPGEKIVRTNDAGKVICAAKTVRGTVCQASPMANGRCKFHGGASLAGPLSATYKHGRSSKYLPKKLRDKFYESMDDKDQLHLANEIAIVDSRINALLQELDNAEESSPASWEDLTKSWAKFMFAVRSGNARRQTEMLPDINRLIELGDTHMNKWKQMQSLIEQRRKLIDTENRRLAASNTMITIEQAFLLVNALIEGLKESVYKHADPYAARKIIVDASNQYKRIISVEPTDK